MITTILEPGDEVRALMGEAAAIGFDKLLYTVEALHGETNHPLQVLGSGWAADYLPRWLDRISQDPLRRMVAKGEVPLTNLPIVFENSGSSLSLGGRGRLSAGEVSLLRWSLSQGVRTGISVAVRMPRGLYATVNFYATETAAETDRRRAVERLFLLGHQAHASLEGKLSRAALRADHLTLSARESECLEWIARGKTNAEIASILGLAPDTAKEHVHGLFRKLQVSSRAQAVTRGYALGYLS